MEYLVGNVRRGCVTTRQMQCYDTGLIDGAVPHFVALLKKADVPLT